MSKTVKVRVPVVVFPGGRRSDGNTYGTPDVLISAGDFTYLLDGTHWDSLPFGVKDNPGCKVYYLTAELPIPDSDEVAAEVEEG